MRVLSGRKIIYSKEKEVFSGNVLDVLNRALLIHASNSQDIDYLYMYYKGKQPILGKEKLVRPEINHKVVENHAQEIVNFKTGYLLGEPCNYVRRGEDASVSEKIRRLNEIMFAEDKASHDRELAQWMHICGVGVRMVLPDTVGQGDESPIEIDTLDPRFSFVVYHSGFGRKPIMGVKYILDDDGNMLLSVYTPSRYFEIRNHVIEKEIPNPVGMIPIIEYALNPERMGAFEPVVPLLDAINYVMSNRLDGLDSFVNSFVKFINCDIDEETFAALQQLGGIKVKSVDGQNADVDIVTSELNQQQTQVLVDYLYSQILEISGVPSTQNNAASTSDTGSAVLIRSGWHQAEAKARDAEMMFKKSEKAFLKVVLRICSDAVGIDLRLADIECKFSRHNTDNLLTKTQALLHMLEAGIDPGVAVATCGLWSDPVDVAAQSKEFLKKWDYEEPLGEEPLNENPV